MEQCDDCSFKFWSSPGVDGCWGESLPDDGLADVRGNEQGNTTSKPITLLQQFVQKDNNETCYHELDNQEHADTCTKIGWLSIKTCEHIDTSLAKGNDDSKEFLGGLVEFAVGLQVKIDVDEMCTSKKLG